MRGLRQAKVFNDELAEVSQLQATDPEHLTGVIACSFCERCLHEPFHF